MEGGPTYNAAADLIERNLAAGRGAKTAFIDDRGALQLCRARRAGEPVCQWHAPARGSSGAADPALPARYDRLSDRLSRGDQGRGRAGRRQHPAVARRIRLHAGRQPGAGGRRVGAGTARDDGGIGAAARAAARGDRLRGRAASRLARRLARRLSRYLRHRADPSGRALLLALLLGLDRPAKGYGPYPFEPRADGRALCRPGARHRRKRHHVSQRRNCSLPMGSATG